MGELQLKLRQRRLARATSVATALLAEAGIRPMSERGADQSETDAAWPHYLDRLRAHAASARRWNIETREAAELCLERLGQTVGDLPVIWFALVDADEPVGLIVPAGPMLQRALTLFVSPTMDLMLTTQDMRDGACVEFNHHGAGAEYELTTWAVRPWRY